MSEIPEIPEDLKDEHRIFSTGKNVRPTAERHVQLIERIASLQQQLSASVPLEKYDEDLGAKDWEIQRMKQEAQIHALEARTQRSTVHEIYRIAARAALSAEAQKEGEKQ